MCVRACACVCVCECECVCACVCDGEECWVKERNVCGGGRRWRNVLMKHQTNKVLAQVSFRCCFTVTESVDHGYCACQAEEY